MDVVVGVDSGCGSSGPSVDVVVEVNSGSGSRGG